MAKRIITDPIPSMDTPWENYAGQRVEEFIKENLTDLETNKYGCIMLSEHPDADSYYHIWCFANRQAFDDWHDPEHGYSTDTLDNTSEQYRDLLLHSLVLQIKADPGNIYTAEIFTYFNPGSAIVCKEKHYLIPYYFRALYQDALSGERDDYSTNGTITIQHSVDHGASWVTVGTQSAISRKGAPKRNEDGSYSSESFFAEDMVDIGKYFTETNPQYFRFRVSYDVLSDSGALLSSAVSPWIQFTNVTYTELLCNFSDQSSTSTIIDLSKTPNLPVDLTLKCDVTKHVFVEVTGSNGTYSTDAVLDAVTNTAHFNITPDITAANEAGLFTHGVKTIRAWITADGGTNGTLSSEVAMTQRMVVNINDQEADLYKPCVMMQGLTNTVENYISIPQFCSYSVWIPSNVDPTLPATSSIDLRFVVSSSPDSQSLGNSYMLQTASDRVNGQIYTFGCTIEAESSEEQLQGYLHVLDTTDERNIVDILYNSIGEEYIEIDINNSYKFAPVGDADFYLNPRVRDNSEANPTKIYNEALASRDEIPSHWSGFGAINDAWITSDVDGQKVLRVVSGQTISIEYDWLATFANLSADTMKSLTFEIDYRVRNVVDENVPIIRAGSFIGSQFVGITLNSMNGTVCSTNYTNVPMQDFRFQEDERTHLVVNLSTRYDAGAGGANYLPLCQVFINGVINREFLFGTAGGSINNTEWYTAGNPSTIVIGNGELKADIDIYSIRVYSSTNSSHVFTEADVLQNYITSLPTTNEKLTCRQENDILAVNGKVSAEKLEQLGKNVIIWHGTQPTHSDPNSKKGWWEIFVYNADGTLDKAHSGTIAKETGQAGNGLTATRQGTTANTYFYSNIQTKLKDLSKEKDGKPVNPKIFVRLENIAPDFAYDPEEVVTEQGHDGIWTWDGWIDGNNMYHGPFYQLSNNTPLGQKMVLKINYASSQQSHLMGSCNLYNDLHKSLVISKNAMIQFNSKARVCKQQLPFHYFTDDSNGIVFQGMGTFGPGKMDDLTWGVTKDKDPSTNEKRFGKFIMLEGADNNLPLTDFRVPWDWTRITREVEDGETAGYNFNWGGTWQTSLDVDKYVDSKTITDSLGNEYTAPVDAVENAIESTVNFLYNHNPHLKVYDGTWNEFLAYFNALPESEQTEAKLWNWWVTGDWGIRRYDEGTGHNDAGWVGIGWNPSAAQRTFVRYINDSNDIYYAAYQKYNWCINNPTTDEAARYGTYNSETGTYTIDWNQINDYVISLIALDGKTGADKFSDHFNTNSAIFHYTFCNTFIAGTDNCSKNTYYVLDPGTMKFELHQDDMDTIFATDNSGFQTKPYYIDRENPASDDNPTVSLYEGKSNVLFNLMEVMFSEDRTGSGSKKYLSSPTSGVDCEIKAMFKSIFRIMPTLVTDREQTQGLYKQTVWGCLQKYFFSTQDYFSQTAYNQQALIRYEYPEALKFKSDGRQVAPISQSLGDQLESEEQYMKRRLVLFASYAYFAAFNHMNAGSDGSIGLEDTDHDDKISFANPNTTPTNNHLVFDLVPHQYIYPTGFIGNTSVRYNVRCHPGETYHWDFSVASAGDTGIGICGANFYREIGNQKYVYIKEGSEFQVYGRRLTKFEACDEADPTTVNFNPASVTLGTKTNNIEIFNLNGATGVKGVVDVHSCTRLRTLDIRNTGVTSVTYPETATLTTIHNNDALTSSTFRNLPNCSIFDFQGISNLTSVTWAFGGNNVFHDTKTRINALRTAAVPLVSSNISGIRWFTGASEAKLTNADILDYLVGIPETHLKGAIEITGTAVMTYDRKLKYTAAWGNIDSASGDLYVKYDRNSANLTYYVDITGRPNIFPFKDLIGTEGGLNPYNEIKIDAQNPATHTYSLIPYKSDHTLNANSNDIYQTRWTYTDSISGSRNSINATTGVLTVYDASEEDSLGNDHTGTISVTAWVSDDKGNPRTTLTNTFTVNYRRREAEVGDYVYADGSWSPNYETDRTVVGICFFVEPEFNTGGNESSQLHRLCCSVKNLGSHVWGLYNNASYMSGITLDAAAQGYSIYDLANLGNINISGVPFVTSVDDIPSGGTPGNYVRRDNIKNILKNESECTKQTSRTLYYWEETSTTTGAIEKDALTEPNVSIVGQIWHVGDVYYLCSGGAGITYYTWNEDNKIYFFEGADGAHNYYRAYNPLTWIAGNKYYLRRKSVIDKQGVSKEITYYCTSNDLGETPLVEYYQGSDGFYDYKIRFRGERGADPYTYSKTNYSQALVAPVHQGFCKSVEDVPTTGSSIYCKLKDNNHVIPQGTWCPYGYLETQYIVNHRNYLIEHIVQRDPNTAKEGDEKILTWGTAPYVDKPGDGAKKKSGWGADYPDMTKANEWDYLTYLISGISSTYGSAYQELYYPAASKCYAYSPDIKLSGQPYDVKATEKLSKIFAANNWFLPSAGDLARIYWYHRASCNNSSATSYTDRDSATFVNDKEIYNDAIFSKAYFGMGTTNGVRNFTIFPSVAEWYWCATEGHSPSGIRVHFSKTSGTIWVAGHISFDHRHQTRYIRSVCAF